jgi:hypothetical protein
MRKTKIPQNMPTTAGSACNPSHSGSRDQEDCSLKPAQANSLKKKKTPSQKGVEWLKV